MVEAGARGYRPIEDYAVIGDCHGGALVARDGDVDWCCLGRFDAEPAFCRLLDARLGGFLSTRIGVATASRAYLGETNILRTELRGPKGAVALTDFMPVGRRSDAGLHDYVSITAPGWLVRAIEVLHGEVDLTVIVKPSAAYAARPAMLSQFGQAVRCDDGSAVASDLPLTIDGETIVTDATLVAGDRRFIVIGPGAESATAERIAEMLAVTEAYWSEWIDYCRYRGAHAAMVRRSALVLKLLTYAPSGAIAAALTTSLPEIPQGKKNWDYRFCWVRDASLTLFSLASLGYSGEAAAFYAFLGKVSEGGPEGLQIGYGLMMERDVPEKELDHLEGYRGSRPVRIGNAAFDQHQGDLYGFILEGALIFSELGGHVTTQDSERYARIVDFIASCWTRPDQGIWEIRGAPRHFVHSKVMCWVTVDRGIRLLGSRPDWEVLRKAILASILAEGRGEDGRFFRQDYDGADLDGVLLLLAVQGLPLSLELLAETTAAVMAEHAVGDLVFRHPESEGGRNEGAFLACSFWLVDALLAAGRSDEARALLEKLCARANDVGLYSEEIDAATGAFLGNFPQALTHLGLIASAVNLELYEAGGVAALAGSYAHRARRAVGATFGWRGVLAAFRSSPGRFKLWSSRRSKFR